MNYILADAVETGGASAAGAVIVLLIQLIRERFSDKRSAGPGDQSDELRKIVRELLEQHDRLLEIRFSADADHLERHDRELRGVTERATEVRDLARDCRAALKSVQDSSDTG